jgi:hypothetical protein
MSLFSSAAFGDSPKDRSGQKPSETAAAPADYKQVLKTDFSKCGFLSVGVLSLSSLEGKRKPKAVGSVFNSQQLLIRVRRLDGYGVSTLLLLRDSQCL